MDRYEIYSALAAEPEVGSKFGVRLRNAVSFFPVPIDEHNSECERVAEIKKHRLKGYRHDMRLLQQCNKSGEEVADAFEYLAPVIDTD